MDRTYIIINGTDFLFIRRATIEDAKLYAIKLMDHSKEIIVREIDNDRYNDFIKNGR